MSPLDSFCSPHLVICGLLIGLAGALPADAAPSKDLGLVKERLIKRYLGEVAFYPRALSVKSPEHDEPLAQVIERMRPDGSWNDLPYAASDGPNLKALPHLHHLVRMIHAYRAMEVSDAAREPLRTKIHRALQYWLDHKPVSQNSFFNTIGSPIEVAKVALLFDDNLSDSERAGCIAILKRANVDGTLIYSGKPATGQNLVWQAGLQIAAGCLEGSDTYVETFARRLEEELQVNMAEGVQPDFSFHQHGPLLYSGGYGMWFSLDGAGWASTLRNTRFAFSPATIDLLSSYILDGQQWMTRGAIWDFGVIGRELARVGYHARPVIHACADMATLGTARQDEFVQFAARLRDDSGAKPLSGNRSFWRSDFVSHVRPAFYASARMASVRIYGNETGNGEAPFNYHLGDGAFCLMKTGNEYHDIFPFWDWRRIPGVTCAYTDDPLPQNKWGRGSNGGSEFAGGVSDGEYGAAAFELKRGGVNARKAWFFFDREIVCLGAGITVDGPKPVVTSVEQTWDRGNILVQGAPLAAQKTAHLAGPGWVLHDGTGYVFEGNSKITVSRTRKSGRWRELNVSRGSDELISGNLFNLWIDHGIGIHDGSYQYVVLPVTTAGEIENYTAKQRPRVLSNTPKLQAVQSADGAITQLIFCESGRATLPNGFEIAVNRPSAVLLRLDGERLQLTVSDPRNHGGDHEVSFNQSLSGDGCRQNETDTVVTYSIPKGPYAGQSISRNLLVQRER